MKSRLLLLSAALLFATPGLSAPPAQPSVAESKQAHSSVSVLVDPQLNDGRLVVKVAAQNRSTAPVPFGPASVSIAKPNGEQIAVLPLSALINDVRVAAGDAPQAGPSSAATSGAYATSDDALRSSAGGTTINGYTGQAGIAPIAQLRGAQPRGTSKPKISQAEAEQQIAVLKQAILQDGTLQPGQVAAGQIVSQRLPFKKGEDRTLHLRVRIAGDEHGFTIAAPAS
jgi:hypothetical protein